MKTRVMTILAVGAAFAALSLVNVTARDFSAPAAVCEVNLGLTETQLDYAFGEAGEVWNVTKTSLWWDYQHGYVEVVWTGTAYLYEVRHSDHGSVIVSLEDIA